MPRERTTRSPAGPGRTVRRPRTPRSAPSASEPVASAPSPKPSPRTRRVGPRFTDIGFTRRALVLVGVVAILALSYANSLRIMISQQRDLATTTAQIEQREAQLATLDAQLQRWRDPAYVKSQARTQLGWVLPGEVGYRVIGADGKVITDAGSGSAIATAGTPDPTRWWDRLATSVQAADGPAAKR